MRRGVRSTTLCYRMLTGGELDRARAEGEQLYLPHFATCPDARRHWKKEVQTS